MIDQPVKLPFLKLNNSLPYYFDESDVLKILSVCNNLKHYSMLEVLFFGCLRSGELCKLDVPDYDPDTLTLRLRETKNGSDGLAGVHCFSRHSSATLMISQGCDLRSVQAILRHRDIHTTLRYTHLCDAVTREKHSQYLTL
jgi:site-specific recombinase XerD